MLKLDTIDLSGGQADDDAEVREILREALEQAGYVTLAAADGNEALMASSRSAPVCREIPNARWCRLISAT